MPAGADVDLAMRLAKHLVDLYAQAEADLLAAVARRIARGIDHPGWTEAKLAEISALRAEAEQRLAKLQADLEPALRQLVTDAHTAGTAQADIDLHTAGIDLGFGHTNTAVIDTYVQQVIIAGVAAGVATIAGVAGPGAARPSAGRPELADRPGRRRRRRRPGGRRDSEIDLGFGHTNTAVIDTYVQQAATNLQGTHLRIFRSTMDAYRAAVVEDAGQVAAGTATRRQVSQRVLDRLADQGITGFVDNAGRNWQIDTYAEMTARTAAGRAQVQGALDRYQAAGKDLVIVSDAPEECPVCRPWEGRVLSISGRTPTGTKDGALAVAGTVNEAVAAGLQHANCRHRLGLYVPGLTRPMHGTADPHGDAARQQQRYLERGVRRWKRREIAALDDDAARRARAKTREWQGRLRDHVDTNDLKRLRYRERVGSAH